MRRNKTEFLHLFPLHAAPQKSQKDSKKVCKNVVVNQFQRCKKGNKSAGFYLHFLAFPFLPGEAYRDTLIKLQRAIIFPVKRTVPKKIKKNSSAVFCLYLLPFFFK